MSRGFTLIELVLVVVIVAVISTLAASRIDSIAIWRQKSDIRRFINTWEFLYDQAVGRGNAYRLVIDLNKQTYFVRREVRQEQEVVRQVDYLKNLRTKGQQERLAAKEEEELLSMDEEFKAEDARQGQDLESLFYQTMYTDPEGHIRLARPLEFPKLAEQQSLTDGLKIRDVKVRGEVVSEDRVYVRFSPRGGTDFAVVHFEAGEQVFTAVVNPATGSVRMQPGDHDFEWKNQLEKKN